MSPLSYLLCAVLVTLAASKPEPVIYLEDDAHLHFERFIQEHNKQYIDLKEKLTRFEIFKENLRKANIMNQGSEHTVFGITQFMDLTEDEFVNTFTCITMPTNLTTDGCSSVSDDQVPNYNAPDSHDWRQHNAVTRVKFQKSCGGCYAFSASGNVEGQHAIKHQQLIELSEQQTIDCDSGSNGCNGGRMSSAFSSMIQLGGLETEGDYPFVNAQQQCQFSAPKAAVRLTGCTSYNIVSQEKLKQLVYGVGPISVAVQGTAFNTYQGGIMTDAKCNHGSVNHAVLVVGYGTSENGMPYWLIKNSWGETFGDQGYIKIQRGENQLSCGMMNNGLMASSIVM